MQRLQKLAGEIDAGWVVATSGCARVAEDDGDGATGGEQTQHFLQRHSSCTLGLPVDRVAGAVAEIVAIDAGKVLRVDGGQPAIAGQVKGHHRAIPIDKQDELQ